MGQNNKFLEILSKKHVLYVGSTYSNNPNGTSCGDDDPVAQHINSEVIIDFPQAENMGLQLTYSATLSYVERELNSFMSSLDVEEEYPVTVWKSRSDKENWTQEEEKFFDDRKLEVRRCRILLD
jgi:hypothetical protein